MTPDRIDHTTAAVASGEDDRVVRPVPTPSGLSSRDPFVRSLLAQWAELVDAGAGDVPAWAERHPALAGCRDLDDVLVAVGNDPDGVLGGLLHEHLAGDELAGRVVVQTMLPKMLRLAGRDPDNGVGDYVAWLWIGVRTYPLARRPRHIAANLALDTLKRISGERWRGLTVVDGSSEPVATRLQVVRDAESLDHNADLAELTAIGVITAAYRAGVIDGPTGSVLATVYADGLSGKQAAERHSTSVDMIRYRCSRGVRRMAGSSRLLAETA